MPFLILAALLVLSALCIVAAAYYVTRRRMITLPSLATASASSERARSPITGFFGLVWMSSTGA